MNSSQWVILIFGILYSSFILFTRKKGNFEEYSVAGRGLGFFLIFSSLCASFIGPGWSMGLVREGFSSGMFMAYLLPFCGLGLAFVGVFLVPRIRNKFTDIYSIGDLVGGIKSHNHKLVRIVTGVFSLLFFGSIFSISVEPQFLQLTIVVCDFPKDTFVRVLILLLLNEFLSPLKHLYNHSCCSTYNS